MAKVIVAMSGGVDSSVSAYLMKQAGHEVIGLFMKNWQESDDLGQCTAQEDYQDVASVCERLGIPYYTVNFAQEYRDRVFNDFLQEYEQGFTPNPDILCNREIKFKVLWEKALSLGADFLATGHYCRKQMQNGKSHLLKGQDPNKDQSYFLYAIEGRVLDHVLFPIGELTKPQVRRLAKELNLRTHDKKDSTGICFIGKRDFRQFLAQYLAIQEGAVIDFDSGKQVGKHQGCAYYTIGQRKGLFIGGPGEPWFVAGKRINANELLVVQGQDHPALFAPELIANEIHWISEPPNQWPFKCTAKIRYRHLGAACTIWPDPQGLRVVFDEKQRAITPRQSIVFYEGDRCLGGAMILTSIKGIINPVS